MPHGKKKMIGEGNKGKHVQYDENGKPKKKVVRAGSYNANARKDYEAMLKAAGEV